MTPVELSEVLRLHGMWRRGESGGKRAYLDGAKLSGAYLDYAQAVMLGVSLDGVPAPGSLYRCRQEPCTGEEVRVADVRVRLGDAAPWRAVEWSLLHAGRWCWTDWHAVEVTP